MHISTRIALKFLFKKKQNSFINIISYLTMTAFAVGTAILVVVLSVFNGFEELLIDQMSNRFNADLVITPTQGKTISINEQQIKEISQIEGVEYISPIIEETVMIENEDSRLVATVKGVQPDYFVFEGEDRLDPDYREQLVFDQVILGRRLSRNLNVDPKAPWASINIVFAKRDYKPLPGKRPLFKKAYEAMGTFRTPLGEYDSDYCFVNLEQLSKLLGYQGSYSACELEVKAGNEKKIKEAIGRVLNTQNVRIKNQYQQEASTYKLLRVEKWMGFLITAFILLLVLFNLMACLWMIVLEKQKDIAILKSMGMTDSQIHLIFLKLGIYYSFLASVIGSTLGVLIVLAQKHIGLVKLSDSLLLRYYPVRLDFIDLLVILAMILFFGFLASIPASGLARRVSTDFRRT